MLDMRGLFPIFAMFFLGSLVFVIMVKLNAGNVASSHFRPGLHALCLGIACHFGFGFARQWSPSVCVGSSVGPALDREVI